MQMLYARFLSDTASTPRREFRREFHVALNTPFVLPIHMPDASEHLLWGLLALPVSTLLPNPLHSRPNRRAFPLLGSCLRADVPLLEHAAVATHVLSLQSRWDSSGSCGAESLEMSLKSRIVLVFQRAVKQIRLLVPQNTGLAIWRYFGWHVQ